MAFGSDNVSWAREGEDFSTPVLQPVSEQKLPGCGSEEGPARGAGQQHLFWEQVEVGQPPTSLPCKWT